MDSTTIQRICEYELGEAPEEIVRKTIGICNEVFEIKCGSNSYILRMNNEKEWIYGTHKFLPIFQKLNIKVPTIIAEDYTKSKYPLCYQIQTKIAGSDLAVVFHELSPAELKAIAKEVSIIFDKFNTLPGQKYFGRLTGLNEENIDNQWTIIENKKKVIDQRNKSSNVIGDEISEIFDQLLDTYKDYFLSVKPKLYYDDMSSKNVMIHKGQFNGIVDLDFLAKGDYLEAIGGIIADWYGSKSGEVYIKHILKNQQLDEIEQKMVRVYAIFHLILWTSEEGISFNSNSTGEINWSNVEKKRNKIVQLYSSIA